MILDVLGNAKQGWNDLKNIVAPITSTIKVGLSTQGIVTLSKEEEDKIIEQLIIEEMLKGGYKADNAIKANNQPHHAKVKTNLLQEPLRDTDTFYHLSKLKKNSLQYILGHGENGELIIQDLAVEPHLIIGGKTGSGKSVTLFNILMSLTYSNSPQTLKISLIDPKILSFGDDRLLNSPFLNEKPSIGDTQRAFKILKSAYSNMMNRYKLMQKHRTKDYRKINLPAHIIFIDELYELLEDENKKEILKTITQIASLGRQAGVHLVIATQSIRAEILGGSLKANLHPIAHLVSNSTESKILECPKAHLLKGGGDGYKKLNGENTITRFQATFIDIDKDSTYQYIGVETLKTLGQNIGRSTQSSKSTQNMGQNTETMEFIERVEALKTLGQNTQNIVNLGLNHDTMNLKQKILNSADSNGKISSKKDLININSREQVKKFSDTIQELLDDNIIEFRKGRGYFLI